MGFLFCLKGLISGFAPLFVFLKPKPANKKTPDLDRSGETDVLFFSSSYRRAIKYGQKDAANEILRTDFGILEYRCISQRQVRTGVFI